MRFKVMIRFVELRLNGPLRQYFSLYPAVFQREEKRKEK